MPPEPLHACLSALAARPQYAIAFVAAIYLLWSLWQKLNKTSKPLQPTSSSFPPITPLPEEFTWEDVEPEKYRPFKGKYNLTMALETLDPSALIPLDKTYKSRLALRRDLLESYPDVVLGVDDPSDPRIRLAVDEYYTFILGTYLPTRYPGVFQLHPGTGTVGEGKTQIPTQMLENRATGEFWPVSTPDTDTGTGTGTKTQLSILSRLIDEDILFLLPSSPPGAGAGAGPGPGEEKYSLKAYSTCFPSGFNPAQKLGLRLADIHGPVPGYEQKLEKSMDRFFAKLEVGRYVKRVNWSVTTDTGLFAAFGGIHGDKDEGEDGKDGNRALKAEELDLDTTWLRVERQTLHRLPGSKALVFAFHTYVYPIQEVKEEGLGEELAQAIDGLKEGNVPQIHAYKRGPVWGDAVKEFLRS